jgi:LPS-assembly protein
VRTRAEHNDKKEEPAVMKRKNRGVFVLILFTLSCFFFSGTPVSAEKPLNISADNLEYLADTNEYIANGSVHILYEDASLQADSIHFNNTSADATAIGNVLYEDSDVLIRAERVELNLDTKLGTIYNSTIFYKKRNFHIRGDNLRRLGETTYSMNWAEVTTCDAIPHEWHIKGEDIKIHLNEDITARKAKFYIKDIPVLYTPYFWAPLARDRQTGFLMPNFGYSDTKGVTLKQGFFWAIRDDMDATIYLDYFDEKGVGTGIDYRYIVNEETNGEFWMYHLRDNDEERDFVELKSYHNQKLPYGMSSYLKLYVVNEFDYYTELRSTSFGRMGLSTTESNPFGFVTDERLQKYIESDLQISKPFTGGRAYFLGQYRLSLERSSDEIPQSLPELALIFNTRDWGATSFNASLTGTNFWREEGQRGQRIDIFPNFFLSFGRKINFTQRAGLRETLYFLEDPADTLSREIFELRSIISTRFLKEYPSFIHIIEPTVEYEYIPSVDQSDIPIFDSVDRIPQTSTIGYAITNRLAGSALGGFESRLRLSNSYSLLDVDEPFDPVSIETSLNSKNASVSANALYDVYDQNISEVIASVTLRGEKGFIGFGKNFRRSTDLDQYSFKAGVFRPLEIFGRSFPIDFSGDVLYDLKGGGVQELNLYSKYTEQCWGIGVSYNQRPFEYQIIFAIEFRGLGIIKVGQSEDIT